MCLCSPLWPIWKYPTCGWFFTENAACEGWGTVFTRKEGQFVPQTETVLWWLRQRGGSLPAVQGSRAWQQHGNGTFDTILLHVNLLILDDVDSVVCSLLSQAWATDDDDEPPFSPVMRKKAVKVKHVKRREKKFDKKVRRFFNYCCNIMNVSKSYGELVN